MHMSVFDCLYVSTTSIPGTSGGQKRGLDSLVPEFPVIVSGPARVLGTKWQSSEAAELLQLSFLLLF